MARVKVDQDVFEAIEYAFKELNYTKVTLLKIKEDNRIFHKDSNFAPLNKIDYKKLENALNYGFDIDGTVVLEKDVGEAIYALYEQGMTNRTILKFAKDTIKQFGGFHTEERKPLNKISIVLLEQALNNGFCCMEDVETLETDFIAYKAKLKMTKDQSPEEKRLALELELDYQLISLHIALEDGDKVEAEKCNKRLVEIHGELFGEVMA